MRDGTWLEAFDHELEAAGVGPEDRGSARVETEGFLREAGVSAFDHFGPPADYAAELAAALGPPNRSTPSSLDRAVGDGGVAVEVTAVSHAYRGVPVLTDVSLTVGRGDVVVLTGANGAGKSTLLRLIAGLERPDAGSITVDGAVGYVPQHGGLDPHLRPREHFELFGLAAGLDRKAANREGERLARELGWEATTAPVAGELSGGTAQKLAVVTALLGGSRTLLLDEPYQGMDADSQQRFWSLLWSWGEEGGSAVVASHAADALAKATTVVELAGAAR